MTNPSNPTFTISKSVSLSATHILFEQGGKCSRLHGHNYVFTVEVTGQADEAGMVMDFSYIGEILNTFKVEYDHRTWLPSSRVEPDPHYPENLKFHVRQRKVGGFIEKDYSLPKSDCVLTWEGNETTAEYMCLEFLKFWKVRAMPNGARISAVEVKETDGTNARYVVPLTLQEWNKQRRLDKVLLFGSLYGGTTEVVHENP